MKPPIELLLHVATHGPCWKQAIRVRQDDRTGLILPSIMGHRCESHMCNGYFGVLQGRSISGTQTFQVEKPLRSCFGCRRSDFSVTTGSVQSNWVAESATKASTLIPGFTEWGRCSSCSHHVIPKATANNMTNGRLHYVWKIYVTVSRNRA